MSIPSFKEEDLDGIAKQLVRIFYPIGFIFDKLAELQHRLLGSPTEENAIRKVLDEIVKDD